MAEITLADFYKGRDVAYASELTPEIQANAAITVAKCNELLASFYASQAQGSYRTVNSGWRPPEVNATTLNAKPNSKHMTGQACDLSDDDEALDNWCLSVEGTAALVRIGLWQESPASTPRWCHIQVVAPASGRRVFIP
ncbi:MAG: hypothetical protein ACRENK_15555 [Gemmatimonadaceae bacterium]